MCVRVYRILKMWYYDGDCVFVVQPSRSKSYTPRLQGLRASTALTSDRSLHTYILYLFYASHTCMSCSTCTCICSVRVLGCIYIVHVHV